MDIKDLASSAAQAYENQNYQQAAEAFSEMARFYEEQGDVLQAAEMRNNQSVALLQAEQAQLALEAAQPTAAIFEQAGDIRRLGIAWGNIAAALDALGRLDEALEAYRQSVHYLGEAGEKEMQSIGLKAIAALQLRQGALQDSAFSVLNEMSVDPHLPWWKRILRKIIHWMIR